MSRLLRHRADPEVSTHRRQTIGRRSGLIALLVIVALSLCVPTCDVGDAHGPTATHAIHCVIAVPDTFQLLVLLNALFLVIALHIVVPPAPAFSLLKPPRLSLSNR
jgi:hypothetical protein